MLLPENIATTRSGLTVVISAVLFLVFDAAVLGLSYWIADEVESDAFAINIAGRQRMLSQQMAKTLLQLQQQEDAPGIAQSLAELREASVVFEHTLAAFERGGQVDAADGRPAYQQAIEDASGRRLVAQAVAVWQPFRAAIADVLAAPPARMPAVVRRAAGMAARSNLVLLDYSNQITNHIEAASREKTTRLRHLQVFAFVLATLNFMVLLYSLWRRMCALHGRQEKLRRQAEKDQLTGLPNRVSLVRRLQAAIDRMQMAESGLVVAFLDLDNFKPVNDIYGHVVGDSVLRLTAKRLRSRLRHSDLIARHGGDEFVVVLEDVSSVESVEPVLQELVAALAEPIRLEDGPAVQLGVSVGAVLVEAADVSPEQLLHAADQLMYRTKRSGDCDWMLARLNPRTGSLGEPLTA